MQASRRRALMFVVWGAAIAVTLVVLRAGSAGGVDVPLGTETDPVAQPNSQTHDTVATVVRDTGVRDKLPAAVVSPSPPLAVAVAGRPSACSSSTADNCLDCLYADSTDCVWCASERRCVNAADAAQCSDVEDTSCPAVTHTRPPQTIRVIHVAIRKGGPEALIQMHLALNHEGFKTTLDTRRSKKQKGGPVVPFFTEMYAKEFAKAPPLRYEANYDAWLASAAEGDVMMSTETWACKNDWSKELANGARQMQWHLTVWPKKPRQGCTISAHTNHIAQEYMQTPRRAVLFPYISPHIVRLAQEKAKGDGGRAMRQAKQNLVMYDGDVKLSDADVKPSGASWAVRKATGFTPQDLYQKYAEAKVGIDLVLPGAERFVYEASLFDVCIIVDNVANGADSYDLPLPARFRVPPGNLPAMHERIRECIDRYDDVIEEQKALKQHTLRQRDTFHRHVRRYFSNSVHVVTYFGSTSAAEGHFAAFILHTLIALPFASIEVRHHPRVVFPTKDVKALRDASYLAAVTFTPVPDDAKAWHPTTNAKRVGYVLVMPPTTVVVAGDLVHVASSAIALLRRAGRGGVPVFAQGRLMVFSATDLANVTPLLPKAGSFTSDLAVAANTHLAATGTFEWFDVDTDEPPSEPPFIPLGRLHRRVAGDFSVQWTTSGQRADLRAKLDGMAGSGHARAVEAGAGDVLTHRGYLCSHPLYASVLPEVCAA